MQLLAQAAESPLASYCPTTEFSSLEKIPLTIEYVIKLFFFFIVKIAFASIILHAAYLYSSILTRALLLIVCLYLSYCETLFSQNYLTVLL